MRAHAADRNRQFCGFSGSLAVARGRSGYSEAVSAAHRGKPDNSPLIALFAVLVVPAIVIGFIIYLVTQHPAGFLILLGAADGVILLQAAHKVVLNLANRQPQSAEQVADRLSLIAQLIGTVVAALAFIGQVRGWMHGMFRDVILGVLVLYLAGGPIYWFGGKRRLIAVLRTRVTDDGPGS